MRTREEDPRKKRAACLQLQAFDLGPLDGLARHLPPVIVILSIVVCGPDIVEDQIMPARGPTHPGPGHIARAIHFLLRVIF